MRDEDKREFFITTNDGERVTVRHGPGFGGSDHFEFRGPITHTGYRSHFSGDWQDIADSPEAYAKGIADELEAEMHQRDRKTQRHKRMDDFQQGDAVRILKSNIRTEPDEFDGRSGVVAGFEPPYHIAVEIEGEKYLRYYWRESLEKLSHQNGQATLF